MSDTDNLREEIRKARAAETKTKTQIYTLRGKKGLQAMAASMGEDLPPQLAMQSTIYEDPEESPQIQELRRQIALIREMERQQHEQIAALKKQQTERENRNKNYEQNEPVSIPRVTAVVQDSNLPQEQSASPGISLQKQELPSYLQNSAPKISSQPANYLNNSSPTPQVKNEAPPIQRAATQVAQPAKPPMASSASYVQSPNPSLTPQNSNSSHVDAFNNKGSQNSIKANQPPGVTRIKKGKKEIIVMNPPASVETKVLNASWDSGSVKSKKANKVYTIQVTMNGVTWKIIRGDDTLTELSKRLSKVKAEGCALPPLVKKVVKRDQQGELASNVQNYLNQIQTKLAFAPKKERAKTAYLKFFAPFCESDEGMGNYQGNAGDFEGWFIWKLGLN